MQNFFCIIILCIIMNKFSSYGRKTIETKFEWKYLDYDWPNTEDRNRFISLGLYDYRNLTPIDVDQSQDGRTFITVIRQPGVPASLHTVTKYFGESGPLLLPYPDWSWYDFNNGCNGIISVYRVSIDVCNRIWVLDTGYVGDIAVCPQKLMAFDLNSNKLVFKQEIPRKIAGLKLVTSAVEIEGQCDHVTVYMADVNGFGLVIWSSIYGFHRLEGDEFKPEMNNSNFTIAGESFHMADGIFGLALTPNTFNNDERFLISRPLASRSIYGINTRKLKRSKLGEKIFFQRGQDVLPSQASAMAFSSEGTLLYGLTGEIGIGCWHLLQPMTSNFFEVAVMHNDLQFISGMKIIGSEAEEEYAIMMSNRLQKIYGNTMNFDEINFRVSVGHVRDMIKGTSCDVQSQATQLLPKLTAKYEWKYFDYEWNSEKQKSLYITNGWYDPRKIIPIDMDETADGRFFITMKQDTGVPASVNLLVKSKGNSVSLLKPYPSWEWYEHTSNGFNCNEKIVSVFRVAIDKCNRLWILDTGVLNPTSENPIRLCPAKLLAFNLNTDILEYRVIIPARYAQNKQGIGLLVTPIVETFKANCREITVFIADMLGYGLVVWDSNIGFKRLNATVYRPSSKNINTSNLNEIRPTDLLYGIEGIAISPNISSTDQRRLLAFSPSYSTSIFIASTENLIDSDSESDIQYIPGVDLLQSEVSAMVFSSNGILFFGSSLKNGIGCWNMKNPLNRDFTDLVVENPLYLQFINALKSISHNNHPEYLLILTDMSSNNIDLNQINFRILKVPVAELINNTVCN